MLNVHFKCTISFEFNVYLKSIALELGEKIRQVFSHKHLI